MRIENYSNHHEADTLTYFYHIFLTRWGVFSHTLGRFFSHRAHRVHGGFWRTVWAHRTPPAYRGHRGLSTKISCNVLWYRL